MHLYHLTIQPPTLITHLLAGSFTGTPKQQEIVLIRGDRFIETVRVNSGRLEQLKTITSENYGSFASGFSSAAVQPVFGTIRSIALLKVPGETNRDYLVVGSDSGATVILSLVASPSLGHWRWERVTGLTHGRSGSRRAIPGQMVAVDPRGRALLTAALESKKFAHFIGRNEDKLSLSSPLESHRPGHLCQTLIALDSGLEHHPAFATIEYDFGELDNKQLESPKSPLSIDLVGERKQLCYYELDQGLNTVVRKWSEPIPFDSQTLIPVPGGSDGPGGVLIISPGKIYHHRPGSSTPVTLILPKSHSNCLLTAWSIVKTKSIFFFFLQFEGGDIFKLKFVDSNSNLSLKYFDTLPEAVGMTVLRSGYLFLATQNGPAHLLYQITGLGDEEEPEFTNTKSSDNLSISRHSELVNLVECDTLPHFGSVTNGHILNLGGEESPQFYLSHKESSSSSVSITRWGTALQELLVLEFPEAENVTGAWSTESGNILLSFKDSSVLLNVDLDQGAVEQVDPEKDTFSASLRLESNTITAGHLDSQEESVERPFLQVHPQGLQVIHKSLREWNPGNGKIIKSAAFNGRQIVLALDSLEMIRLAYDPVSGSLNEESKSDESFPIAIDHVTLAPLLKGRKTSRWMAIGTCEDSAIRILDLEAPDGPEVTAIQALTSPPTSLRLTREISSNSDSSLVLHIGLSGGILIRFVVDEQSGALIFPSSRFVGGEVVKISDSFADGSILALGNRPWWISRDHMGKPLNSPLFFSTIQTACPFKSLPGTFAAISDGNLRILNVQPGNSAGPFYRHTLNLPGSAVPRKMILDNKNGIFAIAQMDRISLFDPFTGSIGTAIEYHSGEVALSCCFVTFHDIPGQTFLAVAGARDFIVTPRSAAEAFIDLFPIDTKSVQLGTRVHRTPLETPATSLQAFNGRLLVGVVCDLRMYECGRSRLLRKTQCKLGSPVVTIRTQGLRIYVGTARDSHTLIVYRPDSNGLVPIADDPLPRGVISDCLLDYDTLAGCDRFGNFFVNRLPAAVSESLEQDRFLAGSGVGSDAREFLLAAPEKFEKLADFHIGDVVTVLERIAWAGEAGREAIWYTTISGSIGCFLPFPTKSLAAAAQTIEKALEATSLHTNPQHSSISPQIDLLLRSHCAYRSSFSPVKSVIDGDLVERFLTLPEDQQHALAQSIDLNLTEIKSKIENLRRLIGI
jgi:splicing factor 3B subunit 3